MRAFVTGIAGFAGSYLAEALLEAGWTVSGALAPGEPPRALEAFADRLALCEVDVADAEATTAAVLDAQPDCIFHLAAQAFVPDSLARPLYTYDVNVGGTLHLLEALRLHLPRTRLVSVSSGDGYGDVTDADLPLVETQPMRPVNPYAATKAAADLLAESYGRQFGLAVVRARAFNHTGPRQSPQYVCADFARQIARIEAGLAEPIVRVGCLSARRDFSDVRDIVRAYCLLGERSVPPDAYNICSGKAVAVSEILDRLLGLAAVPIEVREDAERVRPVEIPEHRGSAARLRAATGWQPEIPFARTLTDTLNYWRETVAAEPSRK